MIPGRDWGEFYYKPWHRSMDDTWKFYYELSLGGVLLLVWEKKGSI
jgi:hypothetical protein